MNRMGPQWLGMVALSSVIAAGTYASGADSPYRLVREIQVAGEGGWDYLSVDASARRLYVPHGDKVVVIDLVKEEVSGEITDTPGVHGFAVAPEIGRGFSSNGRESKASVVDLKTLETLLRVDTGGNPDAILYEPDQGQVYCFNGRGQSVTVFDGTSGRTVASVGLSGKPEFAVSDPNVGRVYCNIEDRNEVVALDTKTHRIVNRWPIMPGEEATGMAINLAQHRLFVGCHNKLMVMMDSANGKVIASVPIGQGVDAMAFDPETRLVFSSCGEGNVTIARQETPEKLVVLQTLATERGARTMVLDPKTHRIYLVSARFEPMPEPAAGSPRQRPKIVQGSFKILVYGMEHPANP